MFQNATIHHFVMFQCSGRFKVCIALPLAVLAQTGTYAWREGVAFGFGQSVTLFPLNMVRIEYVLFTTGED